VIVNLRSLDNEEMVAFPVRKSDRSIGAEPIVLGDGDPTRKSAKTFWPLSDVSLNICVGHASQTTDVRVAATSRGRFEFIQSRARMPEPDHVSVSFC
jgi:hypothetical protein